jgi:hypothetical protein
MSKQNGNMYDWITHTANPLAGECIHNCSYCYVQKLKRAKPVIAAKYTGNPTLDFNGLKQISGKSKFIFLCDMTDLFADNVPFSVINEIIEKCKSKPENRYLLQTKNTKRLLELAWMINPFWTGNYWKGESMVKHNIFSVCTTAETNRIYPKIMGTAFTPMLRLSYLQRLGLACFDKYVTIEPILDFDLEEFVREIKFVHPIQVNIGADSGKNNLPEPKAEKIMNLIKELEQFTIVKQKSNLQRLLQ